MRQKCLNPKKQILAVESTDQDWIVLGGLDWVPYINHFKQEKSKQSQSWKVE